MSKAYLLAGKPQVGKTSTLKNLIDSVGIEHCGGFYTEEIRVQGTRIGFRLVTLDGQNGILAHVSSKSTIRVGRYGVNLDCLESIGLAALEEAMTTKNLIVIDEIGPMELCSNQFKRSIINVLNGSRPLLGTIALKSLPWLDAIKRRERVEVYTLTLDNRNTIIAELTRILNSLFKNNH